MKSSNPCGTCINQHACLFDKTFEPDFRTCALRLDDHIRGRANLVNAWWWIRANHGAGGAWEFVKLWLDEAAERGKVTSLRCCMDSLAEIKQNFSDSSGKEPNTSHNLSGALSRIVLALFPRYEGILEQRPSKLLDGFTRDDVLKLCPFDLAAIG